MNKLVIAVIFYNEIKNVNKTLNQIKKSKMDFILIDDGSDDGTLEIIKKENYKLIIHTKNEGYGRAVKTAANYAKKNNYSYFAIFPGDNQRKISDVNLMYKKLIFNEDLSFVIGSKFHLLKEIPFKRKLGNLFFSKLSKFWGNNTNDVLSGFKIYKTEDCYKIITCCPDNYTLDLIFNYLSNKKKLRYSEVDVNCNYKNQTSKIKNLILTFFMMIKELIKFILFKKL